MLLHRTCRSSVLALALLTPLVCCAPAGALQERVRIGGVEVAVYGPDWTWQGRDVNVLVVMRNGTTSPADVSVRLRIPSEARSAFGRMDRAYEWTSEELTREVTVEADGAVRQAFAGITALSDAPLGEYAFTVELAVGDARHEAVYPVQVVRGAAIRGGRWAALSVPAAIALVWCAAFVVVLSRMAGPRAWRTSPEPLTEPADAPAWIREVRP